MMVGMVLFLLLNFNTLPVVKAGKVTKFCNKTRFWLYAKQNKGEWC